MPEERLARLAEEEAALPPLPPPPHSAARLALVVPLLVAFPLALAVRLFTAPFRRRLLLAGADAERRRLEPLLDAAARACEEPARDADALFARGLALLAAGRAAAAELAFDQCVRRLEAGEPGGAATITLARALHHRGVARTYLRLLRLAQRDTERAASLDPALSRRPGFAFAARAYASNLARTFRFLAGV